MGSCICKSKPSKTRPLMDSSILSNLSTMNKDLVELIIRFHNINTISNLDFETLILEKDKEKAFLLKKKILVINLQIKELQECLAHLGHLEIGSQSELKKFLSECEALVKFFKENCLLSANTEILQNNSDAVRELENELKNYEIDEKGLSAEVDLLLEENEKLAMVNEGFKRKRYIKKIRVN